VAAYTGGGLASSSAVGALLGAVGAVCPATWALNLLWLLPVASSLFLMRDVGLLGIPVPECKHQTKREWAHDLGIVCAGALWGLHLGLGFMTRVSFTGFWILVMTTFILGSPLWGALLMASYWIGRAAPVIVAPRVLLAGEVALTPELIHASFGTNESLRRLHVGASAWWLAATTLMALSVSA
jgi:hypothetical protein